MSKCAYKNKVIYLLLLLYKEFPVVIPAEFPVVVVAVVHDIGLYFVSSI